MTQPCSSTSARSNGTTSFSTARTSSIVPGSVSNRSLCCISTPIWAQCVYMPVDVGKNRSGSLLCRHGLHLLPDSESSLSAVRRRGGVCPLRDPLGELANLLVHERQRPLDPPCAVAIRDPTESGLFNTLPDLLDSLSRRPSEDGLLVSRCRTQGERRETRDESREALIGLFGH